MTGRTLDRVPTRRADGSARASFTDLDCVSDLLCAADTRSGSDSASASCFERGTDPSCLSCALARSTGFANAAFTPPQSLWPGARTVP